MKKVIIFVFTIVFVLTCLFGCSDPKKDTLAAAESSWSEISDPEALKETVGYLNGWFYDADESVYKYNSGDYTVVTVDGSSFEIKDFDGSSANRFEIKDEGSGDVITFPET